jgi:hypothetical protein
MAMSEDSGDGGILGTAGDLLDTVVTTAVEETGGVALDLDNDLLHEGEVIGDGIRAVGDAVTGDGNAAANELQNLVADGFEAIPGHELAWDGLAGLGHAIDGPQSDAKVWGDGGANQFREGVGADPEQEAQPFQLPGEPEVPEA